MNCLDFRRVALAQPRHLDPAARGHAASCPACQATLERELRLDERVRASLDVPVPDGLADRVLVGEGLRRRVAPVRWAVAATVLLAAVAWWVPPELAGRDLAREALAHVAEEPQALRLRFAVPPRDLATALAGQGLRLVAEAGQVTYSQLCPMAHGHARHVVIRTAQGPVTLFLLPGESDRLRRAEHAAGGMAALALPAPRGSFAVVAATAEQARAIASLIVPA
jgi:hypothetical protein